VGQADEEVELRDAVARDALVAAGVGVWDWDLTTGELYWDPQTAVLHGFAPDTFDGRLETFFERVHPDDLGPLQATIQAAVDAGGPFQAEFRVSHPDGSTRWVEGRGGAVTDAAGRTVRMVGLGIDTTHLVQPRAQVARTLEHVSDGLLVLDHNWQVTFANATAAQLLGRPLDDIVGGDFREPSSDGSLWARYRTVMETQQPEHFEAWYGPLGGWFEVRALPAPDSLTLYFRNVDAERAARVERERLLDEQAHQLALAQRLQDLTAGLAQALTIRDVSRSVLEHVRAALDAHYAGLALLEEGRAALTFVTLEELPGPVQQAWASVSLSQRVPLTECVRANRPIFHASAEDFVADVPEADTTIALTGSAAFANLPLPGAHGVIGALSASWPEPRRFSDDDRRFLATVAAQCAQAIERARLYERQQTVANALQQAVLPDRLPPVPGVALAARYEPTPLEVAVHVGGDWYDAFLLTDGRLGFAVGDVCGHGLGAAAIMGTLRNALRAYAFEGRDPAEVVAALNDLLTATSDRELATAVYGVLDGDALTWCGAGHPPLAVVDAGGAARLLGGNTGPLLGLPGSRYRTQQLRLAPGDTLVAFTDGLVEHRSWGLDEAFEHLTAVLARHAVLGVDDLCDALVRHGRDGRPQEDDACVLVLRYQP
jgi:PAS domain S-box-containing protein